MIWNLIVTVLYSSSAHIPDANLAETVLDANLALCPSFGLACNALLAEAVL